ncbi:hypothetical protein AAFF_G00187610 [Aldrovandia affinis]|uniref:Uncharacterized protein n=1 Tax=Aldrovandia affinis TaxID=143900 RepID=A0AAD7WWH0_9TELE|nr:hypothetical protein AAFF_G00187610 [Aldrovandia affinis]
MSQICKRSKKPCITERAVHQHRDRINAAGSPEDQIKYVTEGTEPCFACSMFSTMKAYEDQQYSTLKKQCFPSGQQDQNKRPLITD